MAILNLATKTTQCRRPASRVLCGLLTACCLLAGCVEKDGAPIRIIIPNGFRGLVRIVEDKSGVEVPLENGLFVYRIPTSGVLVVKEAEGFAMWHAEAASFSDGQSLPILASDVDANYADVVALFGIGRSQWQLRIFVGTQKELMEFLKSPAGVSR